MGLKLLLLVDMGKEYSHLSLRERDRITELRFTGMSFREIAKELGRYPSTLSREFKRNATPAYKVYLSHRAHDRAVRRKKEAGVRPSLKTSGSYHMFGACLPRTGLRS